MDFLKISDFSDFEQNLSIQVYVGILYDLRDPTLTRQFIITTVKIIDKCKRYTFIFESVRMDLSFWVTTWIGWDYLR